MNSLEMRNELCFQQSGQAMEGRMATVKQVGGDIEKLDSVMQRGRSGGHEKDDEIPDNQTSTTADVEANRLCAGFITPTESIDLTTWERVPYTNIPQQNDRYA